MTAQDQEVTLWGVLDPERWTPDHDGLAAEHGFTVIRGEHLNGDPAVVILRWTAPSRREPIEKLDLLKLTSFDFTYGPLLTGPARPGPDREQRPFSLLRQGGGGWRSRLSRVDRKRR